MTIHDDQLSEQVEKFFATITTVPHGVDIGSPNISVISIIDDEGKITGNDSLSIYIYRCIYYFFPFTELVIDFDTGEYTVNEEQHTVSVCVRTSTGIDEPATLITTIRDITTSGIQTHIGCMDNSFYMHIIL